MRKSSILPAGLAVLVLLTLACTSLNPAGAPAPGAAPGAAAAPAAEPAYPKDSGGEDAVSSATEE